MRRTKRAAINRSQLAGNVLARVGCTLLVLKLVRSLWLSRQPKHRSLLSLTQERQECDPTNVFDRQCVISPWA